MLIHCTFGGNKSDHTARAYFIQRLSEKVVMNEKALVVISFFTEPVITERYVADGKVKKIVGELGFFKACDSDIGIGIELFCNSSCDAVKLYAIKP